MYFYLMMCIFFFSGVNVLGCRTPQESTQSSADDNCEQQLSSLPEVEDQIKFVEKSKQVGGYVLSYSATAAGYAADAIVLVGEGVVKGIIYCPSFVVAMAAGYIPSKYCPISGGRGEIKGSKLGQSIYADTRDLRTPDFSSLSQAIREISLCFEKRGDPQNLFKAKSQLKTLNESEIFNFLEFKEKAEVTAALKRLESH